MKELMRKAHQMTKEIKKEFPEVDYKAQLGICMSFLINEGVEEDMTVEEKLNEMGCKTWEKKEEEVTKVKRVYINDLKVISDKLGYELDNPKMFNKTKIYYDVLDDSFSFDCQRSVEKHVREVIKMIRATA